MIFALVSAALFGTGTAAQHRVSATLQRDEVLRLGLFARLTRNPLWMLGITLEIGAFACQLVALHRGRLVTVQPILSLSLVIALVITAVAVKARLPIRVLVALVAVTAGLALFLTLAVPAAEGAARVTTARWVPASVLVVGAIVFAVLRGHRSEGRARAQWLAAAAGFADAMMAALAKELSEQFDRGFHAVVSSWALYSVAAMGIIALLLQQAAYQTARPAITLPIIAVTEPLLSVVLGVAVFGEHISRGALRDLFAVMALGVLVVGLAVLARSPLADDTTALEVQV